MPDHGSKQLPAASNGGQKKRIEKFDNTESRYDPYLLAKNVYGQLTQMNQLLTGSILVNIRKIMIMKKKRRQQRKTTNQ